MREHWHSVVASLERVRWKDLIGVALIVAIGAATYRENAVREHEIYDALAAVGARIHHNHKRAVSSIAINDKNIVGHDVFESIARLKDIQSLSLSRSTLGSDQLAELSELSNLRTLSLYNTNVSNRELRYVGDCKHIEVLSLDGTAITSSGLDPLRRMKQLKYLSLARTQVDDDCVETLSGMDHLVEVDLRNTNMTPTGVERIRKLLPDCTFNADVVSRPAIPRRAFRRRVVSKGRRYIHQTQRL